SHRVRHSVPTRRSSDLSTPLREHHKPTSLREQLTRLRSGSRICLAKPFPCSFHRIYIDIDAHAACSPRFVMLLIMSKGSIQQLFDGSRSVGRLNLDEAFPPVVVFHARNGRRRRPQNGLKVAQNLCYTFRLRQRNAAHPSVSVRLSIETDDAGMGRIVQPLALLQLLSGRVIMAALACGNGCRMIGLAGLQKHLALLAGTAR